MVWATAAAANAAPSILPSRAMSTTPLRSQNSPAMAASTSGVASRIVLSSISRICKEDRLEHQASAGSGRRRANSASSRGRNMFSKAPANRITRPWITTTRSRLTRGISKASSEPPW